MLLGVSNLLLWPATQGRVTSYTCHVPYVQVAEVSDLEPVAEPRGENTGSGIWQAWVRIPAGSVSARMQRSLGRGRGEQEGAGED